MCSMQGKGRVGVLRTYRQRWDHVLRGPAVPEPQSSLAADDQVFPSLPPSAIAWTHLGLAVHGFDIAVDALARDEQELDPDVLPALRSSLLHASTALAVLAPARARRIDHALRIAWTAFSGAGPESEAAGRLAPFGNELVVREAAALLNRRNFVASPRWTDRSAVRVAAHHVRLHAPDAELYEATVRHLWAARPIDDAVRDDAVACAESVALTVQRGLDLWRARSTAALEDTSRPSAGDLFARPSSAQLDPLSQPPRAGRRRLLART